MLYSFAVEHMLLPTVSLFTASRFWHQAIRMRRAERLGAEQIAARQWHAVRRIVRWAADRVPFYRERFAQARITPDSLRGPRDLLAIPPVTRQEIAANFPDRVTAEGLDASSWRLASTSGTTSQRMMVIQDFAKRDAVRAAAVHSFTFTGLRLGSRSVEIPPDICTLQCGVNRAPEPSLASFLRSRGWRDWKDPETWSTVRGLIERQVVFRQVTLPSFADNGTTQPDEVLADYVRRIRRARPVLVKGLPTYLLALARYLQERQQRIEGLREVRPMGAALAPAAGRVVAEAFGCPVIEDYGSAELGSIACECSSGQGLHLFSDLFFVEFVRGGEWVPSGETGRILVTDLTNRAMPLVRYDLGDVGHALPGPCTCGRNTPRFRVTGRVQDAVVSRAGVVRTEHEIADFLYAEGDVLWFQLMQRSDNRFDLRVVPRNRGAATRNGLADRLAAFLGDGARVAVSEVRTIPPENGGKFRCVKSTSTQRLDSPRLAFHRE
jgi:phenylacetate-CoA ligase